MTSQSQRYMRQSAPVLVYCGKNQLTAGFVRDGETWESFTEDTVHSYLDEGTQVLVSSLMAFTDSSTPYSSLQAKELRFMLEALIEVKEVFMNDRSSALRSE